MNKAIKSTNGIAISFISSLLSLVIAALLYHLKWNFKISTQQTISLWLIILVLLFNIRLYFRVIFIDNFYHNIRPQYLRISLFLIIPLSGLAGIIWSFFDFSEQIGTVFMIIYSLILTIFSICVTIGLRDDKQKQIESYISILVDICTAGFWGYYVYYIITNPTDRQISDGLQLIFGMFCILMTWEFARMYFEPFLEYSKFCIKILNNKATENNIQK